MATTYPLQIVTHDQVLFDDEIESLIAPGALGYLGILAHHAPLLTSLTQGKLTIHLNKEETQVFQVNGGVLEVTFQGAVILAEEIHPTEQ